MCVHPRVQKTATRTASDVNHDCNKLGQERKCRFRNNLEGFTAPSNEMSGGGGNGSCGSTHQPVRDLEDLVAMGHEAKVCPFYYTRGQIEKAELVLVPYNYLFDKDARETTLSDIPWDNAVVIFDEAHNLESFASESASFDLTSTDIAGCVRDATKVINILQGSPEVANHLKYDNLVKIKEMFLRLENHIQNLGPQTAYNGAFMIEIFRQGCGVNHANHELFIEELRKMNDLLMDMRGSAGNRGSHSLEHFIQCLKRVFGFTLESRCLAKAAFYRVHVSPRPPPNQVARNNNTVVGRTVSYWCFAPSLAMEELANLKVRSILVTSGTLAPLPSYSMELGLPFPHTLENPHIVRDEQIHVRVLGKGVSGKLLTSSYERRKDKDYYLELGNTLVSLAKVTPAGMLVFFPSYSVMETCLEEWGGPASSRTKFETKNNFFARRQKPTSKSPYSFPFAATLFAPSAGTRLTPWKRLLSTKSVVVEPKSSADLSDAMSEFTKFLAMPKSPGCILMGVCRGKISEGIDFANEQSRAVVITGLPFPPSHDAKVKMKREYLDGARAQNNAKACADGGFGEKASKSLRNTNKLSGHEWYTQQAHRAVNQAIGRVIRNQADYGAVLLLDSRFGQPHNQVGLSKWLRPHIQNDEGFGVAVRSLAQFYKTAEQTMALKAEENKRAQAAAQPILEYEEEPLEEVFPSKIALVRRPTDEHKSADGSKDDTSSAYVDPKQVVARINVKDLEENPTAQPDRKPAALKTLPRTTNDAIFGAKPKVLPTAGDSSKQLAVQFMAKVRDKLPASEQSTIRKAIVAMKAAGEKRDTKAYLRAAKSIVDLVIRCERFESHGGGDGTKMLFLFFGLLPRTFRSQVELMSFELVFSNESSFGEYCKEILAPSELATVRTLVGRLLHSLWCRTSEVPLPMEEYLRKAKEILDKVYSTGKSSSSTTMLAAYLKLIPKRFQGATRTFAADRAAASNIKRMKEADKRKKGEDSVNAARFISVKREPSLQESKAASSSKPVPMKRKLEEPFAASKPNPATVNPYARKKAPPPPPPPAAASSSRLSKLKPAPPVVQKQPQKKISVASIIQQVESDAYVQRSSSEIIAQSIPTNNAPHDIQCPVCSNTCQEPWVAECGHMACLSCWMGWLKRSSTCMTCRVRTDKESLARVVYEGRRRRPGGLGAVPATLAQLCAAAAGNDKNNDGDSDDEELEICE